MTSLKISRKSEYPTKYRKYKIIVDGDKKGTIKTGERVEIPIQPGNHELYLKIDWGRSNKIAFTNVDGEKVQFRCCYRGDWTNAFLGLYYFFIKPHEYLLLEKVTDSMEA